MSKWKLGDLVRVVEPEKFQNAKALRDRIGEVYSFTISGRPVVFFRSKKPRPLHRESFSDDDLRPGKVDE